MFESMSRNWRHRPSIYEVIYKATLDFTYRSIVAKFASELGTSHKRIHNEHLN